MLSTPPAMFGEGCATGKTANGVSLEVHPHVHYFNSTAKRDYQVCNCGISSVYFNSNLYNYKP